MITTNAPLEIHSSNLKKAALVYRAINHKRRQEMLRILHKEGRMTVTKIYQHFRLEQSVASQQLAILRKAGLVLMEKDGKLRFYSVNYQQIKHLHSLAGELLQKGNLFEFA